MTEPEACITILYPRKGMTGFDMDYYLTHHIPSTKAGWEPLGMINCRVVKIDGGDFAVNTVLNWKSKATWDAAKDGKVANELGDDVKNFTNVTPVMISGIVVG